MTDTRPELERPDSDPLATLERESVADQLLAQRELIALEQWYYERLMLPPGPAVDSLSFGPGLAVEQTIDGDPRDPFTGVAVLNTGPYPVTVGYAPGAALNQLRAVVVPPFSYLATPVRYAALSIAAQFPGAAGPGAAADLAQGTFRVSVFRLRVPPLAVSAGPLPVPPAKGWLLPPGTAVNAGVNVFADLVVAGYSRLFLISALITATAADLVTFINAYEIDGTTAGGPVLGSLMTAGPTIGSGVARRLLSYDVTALDKVRAWLGNAGAGNTTGSLSYFLGR